MPKRLIQQLIFGGHVSPNPQSVEEDFEQLDEKRGDGRESAYVTVLEQTFRTVIENEPGLLSSQEVDTLEVFGKLAYNARYCLARLVLRKPNQWYAISSLDKYKQEIGEDGLLVAIQDLCKPFSVLMMKSEPCDTTTRDPIPKTESLDQNIPMDVKKEDDLEVIDLTFDTDDEGDVKPDVGLLNQSISTFWANNASSSKLPPQPMAGAPHLQEDPIQSLLRSNPADEVPLDFFCEDETKMSLPEILDRLNKEQLTKLVKVMKCKLKSGQSKKADLIHCLLFNAATQSVLNFTPAPKGKGKGKAKDDGMRQTTLPFQSSRKGSDKKTNQEVRLTEMALKLLGKCVRVNFGFYRLVRRLHIICYRETEHPTALLLPGLLTTFKKRVYTCYNTSRSKDVWESRLDLLEYEKALELEMLLGDLMDPDPPAQKATTKTPAPRASHLFVTPARKFATPLKTPSTVHQPETPGSAIVKEEDLRELVRNLRDDTAEIDEFLVIEEKKEEKMKANLEEWLFPKWQDLLATRSAQEPRAKAAALERFDTGHVYTRMVHKATKALGPLKSYDLELKVLHALLGQKIWMRGKRARWYERRAIVQGHLTRQAEGIDTKHGLLWQTMEGIKEALLDEDTGIVWRPSLVNRLMGLEKRLKIPSEDRSRCAGELRKAREVHLIAERVEPMLLDSLGRPINVLDNPPELNLHAFMQVTKTIVPEDKKPGLTPPAKKAGGKSSWHGRKEIVNVETRALEHYEDEGFKGFHSETRLLTTIFGLLFWDVVFADVPGAFETSFQSAPLDMFEETFYYARKELVDKRLAEIRDGRGIEIFQRHDGMYREKKTWCLCVSWDMCSSEDLHEILSCIGHESLAIICQLFCEDYRGRSSGGPDLFVWNSELRSCKFVEVKGPGDIARENQKFWFDSLLSANIDVEICHVIDKNAKPSTSSKKRKAKTPSSVSNRKGKKATRAKHGAEEEEDYDQLDLTPEDGVEGHLFTPLHPTPPEKRRRIAEAGHQRLEENQEPFFPAYNRASPSYLKHTVSPVRHRMEVLISSPSKALR
ncbi:hypothetical protein M413DRAFT_20952 [Hebeloma cylindrosporum]|uniref:Fanconi-associated nuclease n=1 Tax=Hebeloma cylindrosporum TaxID=76867 RepID=A0A0C3CWT8_HEBCY|nr:hypothetical protein M413DRAFT_20952 [Hebeloma cylindrosporum h7]